MSDASELLALVGGTSGIGAGVYALVKFLGGRVIQNVDDDKKQLQAQQAEAAKMERSIERTLIRLESEVSAMRNDFAKFGLAVDQRAAKQDKEIDDIRAEFKDELRAIEHRLKGDIQRLVSASIPPPRGKSRG